MKISFELGNYEFQKVDASGIAEIKGVNLYSDDYVKAELKEKGIILPEIINTDTEQRLDEYHEIELFTHLRYQNNIASEWKNTNIDLVISVTGAEEERNKIDFISFDWDEKGSNRYQKYTDKKKQIDYYFPMVHWEKRKIDDDDYNQIETYCCITDKSHYTVAGTEIILIRYKVDSGLADTKIKLTSKPAIEIQDYNMMINDLYSLQEALLNNKNNNTDLKIDRNKKYLAKKKKDISDIEKEIQKIENAWSELKNNLEADIEQSSQKMNIRKVKRMTTRSLIEYSLGKQQVHSRIYQDDFNIYENRMIKKYLINYSNYLDRLKRHQDMWAMLEQEKNESSYRENIESAVGDEYRKFKANVDDAIKQFETSIKASIKEGNDREYNLVDFNNVCDEIREKERQLNNVEIIATGLPECKINFFRRADNYVLYDFKFEELSNASVLTIKYKYSYSTSHSRNGWNYYEHFFVIKDIKLRKILEKLQRLVANKNYLVQRTYTKLFDELICKAKKKNLSIKNIPYDKRYVDAYYVECAKNKSDLEKFIKKVFLYEKFEEYGIPIDDGVASACSEKIDNYDKMLEKKIKQASESHKKSDNALFLKIDELKKRIDLILEHDVFNSILDNKESLYITSLFAKNRLYNNFYQLMLNKPKAILYTNELMLNDTSNVSLDKVADLYERWCLIKILSLFICDYNFKICIDDAELNQKSSFDQLREYVSNIISEDDSKDLKDTKYHLKGELPIVRKANVKKVDIFLYYNHPFYFEDNSNSWDEGILPKNVSKKKKLIPDFFMDIELDGKHNYFCFDSKYRTRNSLTGNNGKDYWINDLSQVALQKYIYEMNEGPRLYDDEVGIGKNTKITASFILHSNMQCFFKLRDTALENENEEESEPQYFKWFRSLAYYGAYGDKIIHSLKNYYAVKSANSKKWLYNEKISEKVWDIWPLDERPTYYNGNYYMHEHRIGAIALTPSTDLYLRRLIGMIFEYYYDNTDMSICFACGSKKISADNDPSEVARIKYTCDECGDFWSRNYCSHDDSKQYIMKHFIQYYATSNHHWNCRCPKCGGTWIPQTYY